jgi:1-acyl-sn-glycerol-3-phosphate acyltransferase
LLEENITTMFWKLVMKFFGWKVNMNLPDQVDRCVMIAAPHTSNWDFLFSLATFRILGIPFRFTVKDEMFRFPFGFITRKLGGIAINRRPKKLGEERLSMVDAMANLFEEHDRLVVLVTPEATRSLRTEWKTGFYYVAQKAKVPVALGYLNYIDKEAGVGKIVWPSGDMEKDMRIIMDFYKDKQAKYPEKFSIDNRFA